MRIIDKEFPDKLQNHNQDAMSENHEEIKPIQLPPLPVVQQDNQRALSENHPEDDIPENILQEVQDAVVSQS